jgi:hypothetical protein
MPASIKTVMKRVFSRSRIPWIIVISCLWALLIAVVIAFQRPLPQHMQTPTTGIRLTSAQPVQQRVVWYTYTDPTHKFALQYPSTWYVYTKGPKTRLILREKGKTTTNITFIYPNDPKANLAAPQATGQQRIFVGNKKVVFGAYFAGFGSPASGYANRGALQTNALVSDVAFRIDATSSGTVFTTIKQILASFKVL